MTSETALRVPPQSIIAEQNVLGALMASFASMIHVVDLLRPDDFYRRGHQLIFAAMLEIHTKGGECDVLVLAEWMKGQGELENAGGEEYLFELNGTQGSTSNARTYAKIVADKAMLRRVIQTGTEITNEGFDSGNRDAAEVVASAAAKVSQLTQSAARDGGLTFVRATLGEVWQDLVERDAGTVDPGLPPPFENVRAKLPGLEDTDFCVIAGRPGMGKTVAGLQWAEYAAETKGKNVAFFSLEMSKKQLVTRLLSKRALVNQSRMRRKGGLQQEDWTSITQSQVGIRNLTLAIDDTATLSIDAIRARAARMHAKVKGGLGLIVVDYLQLIATAGNPNNRTNEVSEISRGLKLMAKTLGCPVIALAQLNRGLESRADKRPMMSDLRESGAIEQDADVVVFLFRDDYYTQDRCGAPGVSEWIIAKQRNGPLGTAYLNHHLECSYFEDYHGARPNYSPRSPDPDDNDGLDVDAIQSGSRSAKSAPARGKDAAAGRA